MHKITKWFVAGCLAFGASHALAHVGWTEIDSVPCENPYDCNEAPIELEAGTSISVVYDVIIVHGGDIQIDFSPSGSHADDNIILKQGLAETPGDNSTTITLPDIECSECSLRVSGSGYSGKSKVVLTQGGAADPKELWRVSEFKGTAQDNQVRLSWNPPITQGLSYVLLMSESPVEHSPDIGAMYQTGDWVGDAQVIYVGDNTQWVAETLSKGTPYYFVLYAFDAHYDYSDGVAFVTETTSLGNNPPWVSAHIEQSHEHATVIDASGGNVVISLQIDDADESDAHTVSWLGTDNQILNINTSDQQTHLDFDPVGLSDGTYIIKAVVSDSGTPVLMHELEVEIEIHTHVSHQTMPGPNGKKSGGAFPFSWILLLTVMLLPWNRHRLRLYSKTKHPQKHSP